MLADGFKSSELAHAIGMQIAVKPGGSPFFALETIRGLCEGPFITQKDDGTWASTRDPAGELGFPGTEVLSRCEPALSPGEDAADALAAYSEREERLGAEERRAARLLLWKATGDSAHLAEGGRLLDDALECVPAEARASMCANLRVNREILAAWSGESVADGTDDDEPRGTESVTRIG